MLITSCTRKSWKEAGVGSRLSRFGHLSWPPDGAMGEVGHGFRFVRDDDRVELDDGVTFGGYDIGSNLRAQRQLLTSVRRSMMTDPAADVDPGAENDVLQQRLIGKPQDLAGMHQPLGPIDRIDLADFIEVGR